MKKLLSIILTAALLVSAFIVPVSAVEKEEADNTQKYYNEYVYYLWPDYDENKEEYDELKPYTYYDEVYHHYTNGAEDWALIKADGGMALTEPTTHYMFGMVFSNYQIMVPFTYGYGVYNVAEKKFYDLPEIKDESKFPDIREVLKSFEVGRALDEQVSGSTEVFLKYPKDNLNSSFPLVQKTKTGKYRLYAYCLPLYGNSKQFGINNNGDLIKITCSLLFETDDYLYFSADTSKVGEMEPNADYILQFYTQAMTWTLTMTSECLGDVVVMSGESVTDSDMQTIYFAQWKNNPQCGMRAQLIPNNTFWQADKGCSFLPVYCPKAAFISDALNRYLITSYKYKDTIRANLNTSFADANMNRANCEALGINPVDVYAQYADDNSEALINGEPCQLELNGQYVTVVEYGEKYYADLSYIAKVLGLSDEEVEAYNSKEESAIGDVNNDGAVNIDDATLVQKSLAKITALNYRMLLRADLSRNGRVDIDDATCIQKRVARIK